MNLKCFETTHLPHRTAPLLPTPHTRDALSNETFPIHSYRTLLALAHALSFDVILSFTQSANQQLSSFQIGSLCIHQLIVFQISLTSYFPCTFNITAPLHHAEVHHELAQLLRSSERNTQRDDDNN